MQIHEITKAHQIDEGLLDLAKKGVGMAKQAYGRVAAPVRGAVQGVQQARTDRATAETAGRALKVWNNYARNLKAMTPEPSRYQQLYQQALMAFVQKNLMGNQPIESAINRRVLSELVNTITAAKDNPQQVTALFCQLV